MSTKSKEGQKFWHLKKLALGNKTSEPPLQRPPSPAESAFSVDVVDDRKPRSKRLSALLSSRRTAPNHGSLPTAMSVQNLRALSEDKVQPLSGSKPAGSPSPRQRTMSQTAAMAGDARALLFRSRQQDTSKTRSSEEVPRQRSASPPTALHQQRASLDQLDDQQHPRKPQGKPTSAEDESKRTRSLIHRLNKKRDAPATPSPLPTDDRTVSQPSTLRRARSLRPAASFANLRSTVRASTATSSEEDHGVAIKPPLAPTSPPTSPRLVRSSTLQNMPLQQHQLPSPKSPKPRPMDEKPPTPMASPRSPDASWLSRSDDDECVAKQDDEEAGSASSDSDPSQSRSEDYWRHKFEKERAVVKALQRQKEACNKDIMFLSQSVDELSAEKQEWQQKYETEKTTKERYRDDLSSTCDQLKQAKDQVHHVLAENNALKQQLEQERDQRIAQLEQLEAQRTELEEQRARMIEQEQYWMQQMDTHTHQAVSDQLLHTQDQVRVLKATMEQFLRMGIFSDGIAMYRSIATRFPTTTKTSAAEQVVQEEQDARALEIKTMDGQPPIDLEMTLRGLLREKELLQADHSKTSFSDANVLVRQYKQKLESRLDKVDADISKIKLKMKQRM